MNGNIFNYKTKRNKIIFKKIPITLRILSDDTRRSQNGTNTRTILNGTGRAHVLDDVQSPPTFGNAPSSVTPSVCVRRYVSPTPRSFGKCSEFRVCYEHYTKDKYAMGGGGEGKKALEISVKQIITIHTSILWLWFYFVYVLFWRCCFPVTFNTSKNIKQLHFNNSVLYNYRKCSNAVDI